MTLLEALPKIPQYENIPYAKDLNCQGCGRSGFVDSNTKPNIVGWCETNIGYMIVFECPLCHERYRFHGTIGTWSADKEEFEYYLRIFASQCANWKEVELVIKKKEQD